MLVAARAMKEALKLLEPLLASAGIKPKYTVIIGTVQGDLHDIGKNLISMMWRGAGFAVIDLGTNVNPERYVTAAQEHQAHIVGLSALLTTTMPAMKETVRLLKAAGLPHTKIMIGGAPITQAFADDIGADGYAADAGTAVDVARKLVGEAASAPSSPGGYLPPRRNFSGWLPPILANSSSPSSARHSPFAYDLSRKSPPGSRPSSRSRPR